MRTYLFLFCLSIWIFSCSQHTPSTKANSVSKKPFVLGEQVSIHSEILHEDRILNVYLPYGYDPDSTQRYPVIYLLDGSEDEDFIHVAGLVQYGTFPWVNMLPPSILVGIGNVDRRRDFTYPTNIAQDQQDFPTSGQSESFIRFIKEELIPFIDDTYATSSHSTLIGQSLGGLLATEVLMKKPKLFSQYVIISPSLWWDNESLLELEPADLVEEKSSIPVFVGVGKEGEIMVRDTRSLVDKLRTFSITKESTYFQYFPDEDHATTFHIALYRAFQQLN